MIKGFIPFTLVISIADKGCITNNTDTTTEYILFLLFENSCI